MSQRLKVNNTLAVFLVGLLLLPACANEELSWHKEDSSALKIVDSLLISIDSTVLTRYPEVFLFKDSLLYGRSGSDFYTFDLKKERYLRSFSVDPNFISDIAGFYVATPDSIFLASEPRVLYLIDSNGQLLKKWPLPEGQLSPKYDGYDINYFSWWVKPIQSVDLHRGQIHLSFTNFDIWFFDDKNNYPGHGVFDFRNGNWLSEFGIYPDSYFEKGIKYPHVYTTPSVLAVDSITYISYPLDHYIYLFNNLTGRFIKKAQIQSNYLQETTEPLAFENNDLQAERNFIIQSGYYGELNYHKEINKFTRIVRHNNELYLANEKLNKPQNKGLSVLVMDDSLNVLFEAPMGNFERLAGFGGDRRLSAGLATSDGFIGTEKYDDFSSEDLLYYNLKFIIE
jgi:hypothetical protein